MTMEAAIGIVVIPAKLIQGRYSCNRNLIHLIFYSTMTSVKKFIMVENNLLSFLILEVILLRYASSNNKIGEAFINLHVNIVLLS